MQIRLSKKTDNQKRPSNPTLHFPRTKMRNEGGWSLAATVIMMGVISMFVASMWSTLLPIYAQTISLRYKDVVRAVNEETVDNILASLNTQSTATPASFLATSPSTSSVNEGNAAFTVNNNITNMGSGPIGGGGPPTNSVVYSASRAATNNFMAVTSIVNYGPNLSKQLSVLLLPNPSSYSNPFQYGPAFGVTTVNEVGLACINGYNLPANWTNPYQFADTTVAAGVTWQIGSQSGNPTSVYGNAASGVSRSQVIAGSQFEFWQPGNPPTQPPNTTMLTYEPFTQIMGNVYSNFTDQSGNDGNGYWMRNQFDDYQGNASNRTLSNLNSQNGSQAGGVSGNANVFGTANGALLSSAIPQSLGAVGSGVPSGFENGSTSSSIAIAQPPVSQTQNPPPNISSTVNPYWGYNAQAGTTAGNMPTVGTSNGGTAYQASPYTGGYITSPGQGQAGTLDTWTFPQPPIPSAPGAPIGQAAPATGGLGVPNTTGTYFASTPSATVIQGTLRVSNTGYTLPTSLSVPAGQVVTVPPGNYNLQSLQVTNGGKIEVDPAVQGQTQLFINPPGAGSANPGQGTTSAVYVDNTSAVNVSWQGTSQISGNGFTGGGTKNFGDNPSTQQPAVNTASPIQETGGTALNLIINTNASCNMLFAGNSRALVDAPSANVNVGYQPNPNNSQNYNPNSHTDPTAVMANDANFYGSIIGGNVSIVSDYQSGAGAYLHYDTKLKMIGTAPGVPVQFTKPLAWYDPWQFKTPPAAAGATQQYRAVSWVEN